MSYEEGSRPVDPTLLQQHVNNNLLRMVGGMRTQKPTDKPEGDDTVDIFEDVEEDDLMQPISVETYVEKRMKPLLIRYSMSAPRLSRRSALLENFNMFINAIAVALAVPGELSHWVTFVVSLKALVLTVTQYLAYSIQLGALNSSLRDLQNCMTWWDSLSVITAERGCQRRMS